MSSSTAIPTSVRARRLKWDVTRVETSCYKDAQGRRCEVSLKTRISSGRRRLQAKTSAKKDLTKESCSTTAFTSVECEEEDASSSTDPFTSSSQQSDSSSSLSETTPSTSPAFKSQTPTVSKACDPLPEVFIEISSDEEFFRRCPPKQYNSFSSALNQFEAEFEFPSSSSSVASCDSRSPVYGEKTVPAEEASSNTSAIPGGKQHHPDLCNYQSPSSENATTRASSASTGGYLAAEAAAFQPTWLEVPRPAGVSSEAPPLLLPDAQLQGAFREETDIFNTRCSGEGPQWISYGEELFAAQEELAAVDGQLSTPVHFNKLVRIGCCRGRAACDLSNPWNWSTMYQEQVFTSSLNFPVMRLPFGIYRLLSSVRDGDVWCLFRRVPIPARQVQTLVFFYAKSALLYGIMRFATDRAIKRTIACRSKKSVTATPHRQKFLYPCVDCSGIVLVTTDEVTGFVFGRCLTCDRLHKTFRFDGSCADEPHILCPDDDYVPDERDAAVLEAWIAGGAPAFSFLFSLLNVVGPGLRVVLERRKHEFPCIDCGLGVIAALVVQNYAMCTWCKSTCRSSAVVDNADHGIRKHVEYAKEALKKMRDDLSRTPISWDEIDMN